MRGRIVLFVILAIVTALVGVYIGRSTTMPKAVGEPATTTQADSPVGSTQRRDSGSGPSRTPTPSLPKATPPKAQPPKAPPPKAPPPKPPAPPSQQQAGPVRFGKVTTTPSDTTVRTSIAESDRRALTTTFDDRVVQVGPGATEPATRSFAMTLPVTDGAKGETLTVHVQGLAAAFEGASARLTLGLNGQVKVRTFSAGWDDTYIQTLQVPAIPVTTYRLSGVLEVHQDPGTNGYASMNVTSVDVGIG